MTYLKDDDDAGTDIGPAIELDHADEDFEVPDLAGIDDDEDQGDEPGEFGDLPAGDYLIVQLLDGSRYPLRITMRERIAYDTVAMRKNWGRPQEAPNRAGAFMAWSAGRREQVQSHAVPFEAWVDTVDDCTGYSVAARPTR